MNLPPRIEAKIVRIPFCGCWIWSGSGERYGTTWFDGKRILAHHLLFRLAGRSIPEGMEVMHSCDTGLCVNPDHLSVGTHADNMLDKKVRGRAIGIQRGHRNRHGRIGNVIEVRVDGLEHAIGLRLDPVVAPADVGADGGQRVGIGPTTVVLDQPGQQRHLIAGFQFGPAPGPASRTGWASCSPGSR